MVIGLTTDEVELVALIVIGALLIVGVAAALLIKAIVGRLVALAVMVVLAVLVWTQRSSISDCAEKAKANYSPGQHEEATCRFFGYDVDVDLPG